MAKKKILIFDVLTLFPSMFEGVMNESIIGRAQKAGLAQVRVHNLRDWSDDKRHQKIDDRPFGGGAGMVIRAEPVYRALKSLGAFKKTGKPWVIFLSPQGKMFNQQAAKKLSARKHVLLIAGHYEGLDERVMAWVDEEISIGDFVLTGGEIPAMAVMDATVRLLPGVVGDPDSLIEESFSTGRLDFPHFTRPGRWRGKAVPDVLLSGNHRLIQDWREKESLRQTRKKRPDLLKNR